MPEETNIQNSTSPSESSANPPIPNPLIAGLASETPIAPISTPNTTGPTVPTTAEIPIPTPNVPIPTPIPAPVSIPEPTPIPTPPTPIPEPTPPVPIPIPTPLTPEPPSTPMPVESMVAPLPTLPEPPVAPLASEVSTPSALPSVPEIQTPASPISTPAAAPMDPGPVGPNWLKPGGGNAPSASTPTDPSLANAPLPWQVPSAAPQDIATPPPATGFDTASVAKPSGFPVIIFVVLILGIIVAIGIFLFANHSIPGLS